MRFRFILSIAVLVMFFGCAHQEDVIILDQRLSKVEALGKKLNQKASILEKKAMDLEKRDQRSGKEIEQSRDYLSTKISEFEKDLGNEDIQLRTEYAKLNAGTEVLKDDVQLLRGRLEESEFMIQKRLNTGENAEKGTQILLDKLSTRLNRIEVRLQYIEQYLNLESAGSHSAPEKKSQKAGVSNHRRQGSSGKCRWTFVHSGVSGHGRGGTCCGGVRL